MIREHPGTRQDSVSGEVLNFANPLLVPAAYFSLNPDSDRPQP